MSYSPGNSTGHSWEYESERDQKECVHIILKIILTLQINWEGLRDTPTPTWGSLDHTLRTPARTPPSPSDLTCRQKMVLKSGQWTWWVSFGKWAKERKQVGHHPFTSWKDHVLRLESECPNPVWFSAGGGLGLSPPGALGSPFACNQGTLWLSSQQLSKALQLVRS